MYGWGFVLGAEVGLTKMMQSGLLKGGKMLLCLGWRPLNIIFVLTVGKVEGLSQVQAQSL